MHRNQVITGNVSNLICFILRLLCVSSLKADYTNLYDLPFSRSVVDVHNSLYN